MNVYLRVAGWVPAWQPAKPESAGNTGFGATAGRWSLLTGEPVNPTVRALALVENLFDRYGVISRGAAMAEQVPGGFPALQPVLRRMEDAGRVLRGRFVSGLGAAQFADLDSIERLRELAQAPSGAPVALSANDPANPFGWLLPWPIHPGDTRPSRRAGAMVVIRGGRLVCYLGPSGRQLLSFFEQDDAVAGLCAQAAALKRERRRGFTLETVDNQPAFASPVADALTAAGFSRVPRGYAWYG